MHLLEGGEKEIRAQLEQSLDAFFEFYPEICMLFLRGHLGIGIPPGAQLQPPAHPAQPFGRIRSAFAGAHRAQHRLAQTIRFNRPLGFFQKLFRHHDVRNQRFRSRSAGRGCACASQPHYISLMNGKIEVGPDSLSFPRSGFPVRRHGQNPRRFVPRSRPRLPGSRRCAGVSAFASVF